MKQMTSMDAELSYDLDPIEVARYLLAQDSMRPEPDVTQLKLQKLMYLAQANYLAATGRRLFAANVEAFDHGPVVYSVYREFKGYERSVIAPDNVPWSDELVPEDAREFLDAVWRKYRDRSATSLRALTHSQSPWIDNYESGAFRRVIPDKAMTDYFRNVVSREERILHPSVVVIDESVLQQLHVDEEDIVAQAVDVLR